MWSIKILKGPRAGEKITLKEGDNTIGRSSQCDIYINSQGISKEHAKIVVHQGQATLIDLNSTNGTFVNGVRIQKQKLRFTDKISIFDIMMGFESMANFQNIQNLPAAYPTQGSGALQFQPQMENMPDVYSQKKNETFDNKDIMAKAEDYIDAVVLPGVYKIPENLEMKWSIATLVFVFVFIVTVLSVFPMIALTKSGIQKESQRRALSLAKSLAERYQISARDGSESSFSVVPFEREEGVKSAYIISSGDGTIMAPAKRAGTRPDDAFIHTGRKQDQAVSEQINDNEIGAMFPIKTFDNDTGSIKVLAHAVILYDMGSLSIDTSRTLSLFVQIFSIALLFGFLLYYFIYKIMEFPIKNLNKQIDSALKDNNAFAETKFQFPVLQELINNINTLISRSQNPQPQNSSLALVDTQMEAQNLIQNYPAGALAVDKNEYILSVNEMFSNISGLGSQSLQGLKLEQMSDQAFILSIRDLIEQSKHNNGLPVYNSLDFNGRNSRVCLQPLYDKTDIKYYIISVQFDGGGEF